MMARSFAPLLQKGQGVIGVQSSDYKSFHASVLINMSAKVGSITDNGTSHSIMYLNWYFLLFLFFVSVSVCLQFVFFFVSLCLSVCLSVCLSPSLFQYLFQSKNHALPTFCYAMRTVASRTFFFFFFFFWRSPAISLGFTTFGRDFCVCDRSLIQPLR